MLVKYIYLYICVCVYKMLCYSFILFKQEEYKEECVEIPFNYEDTIATKKSRNELIECEKAILLSLNDSGYLHFFICIYALKIQGVPNTLLLLKF